MRNRSSKTISIVALLVCVVSISVGFAAFATSLNINNSQAEVKPTNSLNVHFPTSGSLTATGTEGATGATITLDSTNGTTISGLKANFQKPGQTVTYSTTIKNDSSYAAYLKSVTFSKNGTATCSPATGTGSNPAAATTITSACSNMKMYLTVGNTGSELVKNITSSESSISNKSIASNASVPVTIKLAYEGSSIPDGDFLVDFGNITFNFSSTN